MLEQDTQVLFTGGTIWRRLLRADQLIVAKTGN